ncbi:hypothetical protein V8E36_009376 [Tilletia maclaganii]
MLAATALLAATRLLPLTAHGRNYSISSVGHNRNASLGSAAAHLQVPQSLSQPAVALNAPPAPSPTLSVITDDNSPTSALDHKSRAPLQLGSRKYGCATRAVGSLNLKSHHQSPGDSSVHASPVAAAVGGSSRGSTVPASPRAGGLGDDDANEGKVVMKNKILAVGRMGRVFVLLCEEAERVSELKLASATGKLPYGTLALGSEGIKKAITSSDEARKVDIENERLPLDLIDADEAQPARQLARAALPPRSPRRTSTLHRLRAPRNHPARPRWAAQAARLGIHFQLRLAHTRRLTGWCFVAHDAALSRWQGLTTVCLLCAPLPASPPSLATAPAKAAPTATRSVKRPRSPAPTATTTTSSRRTSLTASKQRDQAERASLVVRGGAPAKVARRLRTRRRLQARLGRILYIVPSAPGSCPAPSQFPIEPIRRRTYVDENPLQPAQTELFGNWDEVKTADTITERSRSFPPRPQRTAAAVQKPCAPCSRLTA